MLLGPPIIGLTFFDIASDGESSTTSGTYVQKARLSLPSTIAAGRYRMGWSGEWSLDDENAGIEIRVQLDDVTDLAVYKLVPKKKYSDGPIPRYYVLAGFCYVALTAAAHTIDLDFESSDAAKIAYLRRVRLESWRVGD